MSTARLLVMEWLDGTSVRDGRHIDAIGVDRAALADQLLRCALHQMLIEGHFHGTQTTYALETLGHRLEAIELGTVPRFNAEDTIRIVIPPDHSWVFPRP